MAALPKRKTSKARTARRRSHLVSDFKAKVSMTKCPSCGNMRRSHHVCEFCGKYDNKIIL